MFVLTEVAVKEGNLDRAKNQSQDIEIGMSNGPVSEWEKSGYAPNPFQYFLKHTVHILACTL